MLISVPLTRLLANRSLFGKLASEDRLTSTGSNSQQTVNSVAEQAAKNDDWMEWVAPYTNDKLNDIYGTYDW